MHSFKLNAQCTFLLSSPSTVVQSVAVCPVVSPFQQHDPDLPNIHGMIQTHSGVGYTSRLCHMFTSTIKVHASEFYRPTSTRPKSICLSSGRSWVWRASRHWVHRKGNEWRQQRWVGQSPCWCRTVMISYKCQLLSVSHSTYLLQRNVRTENVDNAEEQKRIKGNTVAYGIKIQVSVSTSLRQIGKSI